MIQTIGLSDFRTAFHTMGRKDNFSYEGLELIFDYITEYEDSTGEQQELDVIGICCDWAEDTPENIALSYDIEFSDYKEAEQEVLNYLYSRTQVLGVTDAGTIVYCSSF